MLNLSQALRSRILIGRNWEEHEQRPADEREHSGPAVSEKTRQGLMQRKKVTSIMLGSLKCYPYTILSHEMFVNLINIFQYLIWSMTWNVFSYETVLELIRERVRTGETKSNIRSDVDQRFSKWSIDPLGGPWNPFMGSVKLKLFS